MPQHERASAEQPPIDPRQHVRQVLRDKPGTEFVGGLAMQPGARTSCLEAGHVLREQSRNKAGQDVARPSSGQCSGGICSNCSPSVRRRDHGIRPLQQLNRPVEGRALAIIEAISAETTPSIAIDVPSGIWGDTGAVMGSAAIKAVETVTFFRRKPGHLLMPGRLHCGTVTVADIGISSAVLDEIRPQTWANEPPLWLSRFPRPSVTGHKYDRGHVVVVSGEMPSTGAAKLAARGALRAGAGLVTIASPTNALVAHAAESIAVMVREVDDSGALANFLTDRRRNAVVIGPGGGVGEGMRKMVAAALASSAAVVLDADALTSFANKASDLAMLIKTRKAPTVLTPHEGEFARLFDRQDIKLKLEETRVVASEVSAIVLLKGPDTVIAAPDGRAAITANSPATLATAGAGDVLAGLISGLLAQNMPGFEAACAGAWLHGEAANEFGPGLISEDLPDMLPRVFRRLFS